MENEKNNNQLQIELKEEVAQGTYANLAIITHSSSESGRFWYRVMPVAGVASSNLHCIDSTLAARCMLSANVAA